MENQDKMLKELCDLVLKYKDSLEPMEFCALLEYFKQFIINKFTIESL